MKLKLTEKVAVFLFLMFCWCGCSTQKMEEKHSDTVLSTTKHDTRQENDTTTTGPVDKDSDTKTSDVGVVSEEPDGSVDVSRVSRGKTVHLPKGSKIIGTVTVGPVKEATTHEHDAQKVEEKKSSGTEDDGLDLRSHEDAKRTSSTKPAMSCATAGVLWGLALCVAAFFVAKEALNRFLPKVG